jgi:hypothetical protein
MFHLRDPRNDEGGGHETGESREVTDFIGLLNGKAGRS